MTKFQVTLNFNINTHDWDIGYESNTKAKKKAFERTDRYYEIHDIIAYIKGNDAMEMVEYSCCDAEVLSATWDTTDFAIHMVVETEQTAMELREDLQSNSLEDGEYEACGETAWILFTRDEEGNAYDGGEGSETVWEYGLVDYRSNPIQIKPLDEVA